MNPETAMFEKVTTRSVLYSYQALIGSAFAAAVHERSPKNLTVQKWDMESYMYKSHLQVAVSDYRALARVIESEPAYLTAAAGTVVIPDSTVVRL